MTAKQARAYLRQFAKKVQGAIEETNYDGDYWCSISGAGFYLCSIGRGSSGDAAISLAESLQNMLSAYRAGWGG